MTKTVRWGAHKRCFISIHEKKRRRLIVERDRLYIAIGRSRFCLWRHIQPCALPPCASETHVEYRHL